MVEEVSKTSVDDKQTLSAKVLQAIVDTEPTKIDIISDDIKEVMIEQTIESAKNQQEGTGIQEEEVIQRLYQISDAGFFGNTKYEGSSSPNLLMPEDNRLAEGLFVFPSKEKDSDIQLTHEERLKLLSEAISVSPIRLSRLVDISVESPNRNEAALIANTVVSVFLEMDNSRKEGKLKNAIQFLRVEANNLSNAVHTNYMALHNFKLEWDIISLEDTQNTTLQALLKAQADYDSAHSRTVTAQAAADEAARVFAEVGAYSNIPDISEDLESSGLFALLIELSTMLSSSLV